MLRRNRLAKAIAERDGDLCWICGYPVVDIVTQAKDLGNNSLAASVDHFIPASDGGTRSMDNIRLSHRCCNVRRANRPLTEEIAVWCRRTVERISSNAH